MSTQEPWWFKFARCREMGIDKRTFTAARGGAVQLAKTICSTCPAEEACLWYAMALEDWSNRNHIYGGTAPKERENLANQLHLTREVAVTWYQVSKETLLDEIVRSRRST